ncbi:MAG TPA: glycosyltransferase [Phycisphaerae bacterium]|jgi:MGT family glycosyltransferase|nr:glycosyltransferase [Phycisphaerae bacterium]
MSRNFLFTCWEGGGNVTPVLEVIRRLVAAGHRVRFMSDACNRPEAEAAGGRFIGWTRAPSRKDRTRATQTFNDWAAATPQQGLLEIVRDAWCGPALAYAQDLLQELRHDPADLVVASEMLFGVMAGCESIGQRFAIFAANIRLAPTPGIPPLGPGLPPARTAEERAMHAQIARAVEGMFDSGLPALNAARAALGLGPLAHLVDQFAGAAAELLATARAFDFPAESLPEHVRYVGPMISDPHWVQEWKSPWPAADARPLVAVGFSTTFQNHARVLQNVIDALAPLPVRVLVTLGGSIEEGELGAAANTVIVPSAPHTRVMREAALAVTHGGHGTVMRALVNRVPQLVIPHGRDQNDNAVRVSERGAGLTLTPDAPVEAIRAACIQLLDDPRFRAAARKLGDRIAAEAEGSNIVAELEALAATHQCAAA